MINVLPYVLWLNTQYILQVFPCNLLVSSRLLMTPCTICGFPKAYPRNLFSESLERVVDCDIFHGTPSTLLKRNLKAKLYLYGEAFRPPKDLKTLTFSFSVDENYFSKKMTSPQLCDFPVRVIQNDWWLTSISSVAGSDHLNFSLNFSEFELSLWVKSCILVEHEDEKKIFKK